LIPFCVYTGGDLEMTAHAVEGYRGHQMGYGADQRGRDATTRIFRNGNGTLLQSKVPPVCKQ
jgi:hypothetical protein